MPTIKTALLVLMMGVVHAQRGSYAGRRPIGYPMVTTTTTTAAPLADKFGEGDVSTSSTTTIRLPIEALGDRDLVDRISKLPEDKQPFWYLNWQALEAHRKNPQSYDPNPNSFVDPSRDPFGVSSTSSDNAINAQGVSRSSNVGVNLASRLGRNRSPFDKN